MDEDAFNGTTLQNELNPSGYYLREWAGVVKNSNYSGFDFFVE